jgi:hypothetical protein
MLKNFNFQTESLPKKIKLIYLKAFCYTRNDNRHFRVDRIQKLEIFDLNF